MTSDPHGRRDAAETPDGEPALAQGESPEHQLRNLAQALTGYLELLASRNEDEASARYIECARTAALGMVVMTDRLTRP